MQTTYEGEGENRKMVIHGNPFIDSTTPTNSMTPAVSAPEIYENYVKQKKAKKTINMVNRTKSMAKPDRKEAVKNAFESKLSAQPSDETRA